jgi:hypothetical protein
MSSAIRPEWLKSYCYQVKLSDDNAQYGIFIPIPPDVDPRSIRFQKTSDSSVISVFLPNEIPFFAGKFYGPVIKFTSTVTGTEILLKLSKDPSSKWPILVVDAIVPDRQSIDPQAAVELSLYARSQGNQTRSMDFLRYAVQCRFPPAAILFARMLIHTNSSLDELLPILLELIDNYQDPTVCAFVGLLSLTRQIALEPGLHALRVGVDLHDEESILILGISLSPLEEPSDCPKDPLESLALLESISHNPRTALPRAKLIAKGIGCTKDEELARELIMAAGIEHSQTSQLELLRNRILAPLPTEPDESDEGWGLWGLVAGLAMAIGVVGGGYTLYRRYRK